jgi:hypothetical protein
LQSIANVKSIFLLLRENVIPAKAGIYLTVFIFTAWITESAGLRCAPAPAFAGMTEKVKTENCFDNHYKSVLKN